MTKGVLKYKSDMGLHCIRLHYSADPDKDPETTTGRKWFDEAVKAYPGGVKSAAWCQEMEIDWETSGGELVFPQLTEHYEKIVIRPFEVPSSWDLYASFDYGHRNPSSFHVYGIDHDGNVYAVWEYYMAGKGYRKIAQALRACPYFDKLAFMPIADPSIWAKNQQVAGGGDDNDMKSIAQLFFELPKEEQIMFVPGKKGGDITVAEKINGNLWNEEDLKNGKRPGLYIFMNCPMMIWELKKLRYKDYSAVMQEHRNLQEEIVDRDNHSYDDLKMFLTMFFGSPVEKEQMKYKALKEVDPTSYKEWKRVEEIHNRNHKGKGMGDFE